MRARVAERLLAALGPAVDAVSIGKIGQPATVIIEFKPAATPAQQVAAQAVVNAFDWSEAADDAFAAAETKKAAKVKAGERDADSIVRRAIARVTYQRLTAITQAFNALRTRVASPASPMPPALPVPTWPQFLAAVRQAVDDETDPEA